MTHKKIKRPLLPAFIFMTAGVVLRINAVSMLTAIAFAVTGITLNAAVYHFRGKQRNQFIFIQILVFIFLFLLGYFITFSHDISDNGLKNQEGQLTARIEKVTAGEYSTRLMLSDCRYDGEKMKSKIVLEISQTDGAAGGFKRGDCIDAHVILQEAAAATNPGQFDQRAYYKALGYGFYVKKAEITDVWHEKDFVIDTLEAVKTRLKGVYEECCEYTDAGVYEAMVLGDKSDMDGSLKGLFSAAGIGHILAISGVKTLKLGIPLVPETRINWAFVPLHIAIIYILKLCLDEEIIPRCRFPCSRGYLTNYINWQKKQ